LLLVTDEFYRGVADVVDRLLRWRCRRHGHGAEVKAVGIPSSLWPGERLQPAMSMKSSSVSGLRRRA
jgi:hypothetical protein